MGISQNVIVPQVQVEQLLSDVVHHAPWITGSAGLFALLVVLARNRSLDPIIKSVARIMVAVFAKPIETMIEMWSVRIRYQDNLNDLKLERKRAALRASKISHPAEPPPDEPPPHNVGSAKVISIEDYKVRRSRGNHNDDQESSEISNL